MTPKLLNAVRKGHTEKLKAIDSYIHQAVGYYGQSMMFTVLDGILNGRKAKIKYEQTPLMGDHYVVDKEYTQEEFDKLSESEQIDILKRGFGLDRLEKGGEDG